MLDGDVVPVLEVVPDGVAVCVGVAVPLGDAPWLGVWDCVGVSVAEVVGAWLGVAAPLGVTLGVAAPLDVSDRVTPGVKDGVCVDEGVRAAEGVVDDVAEGVACWLGETDRVMELVGVAVWLGVGEPDPVGNCEPLEDPVEEKVDVCVGVLVGDNP